MHRIEEPGALGLGIKSNHISWSYYYTHSLVHHALWTTRYYPFWTTVRGMNGSMRSRSHLLHGAKHKEDCTHEHREDHHWLQRDQLVFWGSQDMVGQKHPHGSDDESAPEGLILASVHVGSNDAPISNLLIQMAETQTLL
jgi:hypothetical protein